ncbi:MAG: histidine kinase [Saprospiraceae bacterium]|nr:histidine kinase [Saprospiraceae bacterium]
MSSMSSFMSNQFRAKIYDLLTNRIVYHGLFWLVLLILLTAFEMMLNHQGLFFTLSNQLVTVAIYSVVVYFNLFYLIPNYLTRKRFLTYGWLLILLVIIVTPLKAMILYLKFANHPVAQSRVISELNFAFIPTLLIAGASTLFKITTDWVRHLRERQELETQTMQSELRFLKSQINPHFLFNTLNNLYALTLKKSDKAPEIVIKLSEMMRYMLYECNEKQVYLSKEVNYLRNYLDLERLRQGKNVEITFEVNGNISDQMIAPLLFIPFLENSFKHGLNNNLTQGYVHIRLQVDMKELQLYIENSKSPVVPKPDSNRKSGGIGLVNVRRRLNILYPNEYELQIDDSPTSYGVLLSLNLDHEPDQTSQL